MWEIEKELLKACERLIQQGLLDESAFLAARTIQQVNGEDLGLILERMGVVSSEALQHALSTQWGCRFLSDEQVMLMWEEGAIEPPRDIPLSWMAQDSFVPLRLSQGTLTVLVWRPLSESAQTRLCRDADCAHLEYVLVSSPALRSVLERLAPGQDRLSMTSGELDALVPPPSKAAPSLLQIASSLVPSSASNTHLTQGLPTIQPISSDDLLPSARKASLLDFIEQGALSEETEDASSSSLEELASSPEVLSGDDLPNPPRSRPSNASLRSSSSSNPTLLHDDHYLDDSASLSQASQNIEIPRSAKSTVPPPSISLGASALRASEVLVTNPMSLVTPSLATMSLDTISGRGKAPLDPSTFLEEGHAKRPEKSSSFPSAHPEPLDWGASRSSEVSMHDTKHASGGALVIGESPSRSVEDNLSSAPVVVDPSALMPQSRVSTRKNTEELFDGRGQAQAWMRAEQVASSSDALDVIGSHGDLSSWRTSHTPESIDSLDSIDAVPQAEALQKKSAGILAAIEAPSKAPKMFVEDEPTSVEDEDLFSQAIREKMAQAQAEDERKKSSPSLAIAETSHETKPNKNEAMAPHLSIGNTAEEGPSSKPLMRTGRDYRTLPVGVIPSLLPESKQEEPSFALFERPHLSEQLPQKEESLSRAKLPSRARTLGKEASPSLSSSSGDVVVEAAESRKVSTSSALLEASKPSFGLSRLVLSLLIVVGLSFCLWYFLLRDRQEASFSSEDRAPFARRVVPAPRPRTVLKASHLRKNVPPRLDARPRPVPTRAQPPKARPDSSDGLWRWDAKKKKLVPIQ